MFFFRYVSHEHSKDMRQNTDLCSQESMLNQTPLAWSPLDSLIHVIPAHLLRKLRRQDVDRFFPWKAVLQITQTLVPSVPQRLTPPV